MTSGPVGSDLHRTGGRTFNKNVAIPTSVSSPAIHVLDRSANSHRKTSSPRQTTCETHTVAFQEQLLAGRRQCTHRPTITHNKTCSANIYRRIKRRVGCSLKRAHCKRYPVPSRKQAAYKLFGAKSSFFLALKEFQDLCSDKIVLVPTDNTTVVSYCGES